MLEGRKYRNVLLTLRKHTALSQKTYSEVVASSSNSSAGSLRLSSKALS